MAIMLARPMRIVICWVLFLAVVGLAGASTGATAIDVTGVQFTPRRLAGSSYNWLEAEVALRTVASTPVQDITLTLYLSFREPTASYIYRGSVTLYALERTARVRFYLPPDVIRVRRLNQTPQAYLIQISSSAGAEPFVRAHASANLVTPAQRQELLSSTPISPLIPHYATPFYSVADTWRDLPAYVVTP